MKWQLLSKYPKDKLYTIAFWLGWITIIYNLVEGIWATTLGLEDEALVLFGFGVDSFIEMISGIGILHMIIRIKNNKDKDDINFEIFEVTALKITGYSFYALVVTLVIGSIINIITDHKSETTMWGIIISLVSILMMLGLIYGKINVGKQLGSSAIIADANCTKVCIYMSFILLLSSGLYELTRFVYVDSIGALFLAWFSLREGKECFKKAKNNSMCCIKQPE